MRFAMNPGRLAGLFYVVTWIFGFFAWVMSLAS